MQGQSAGAEGPEREGPDRGRGMMETSGGLDVSPWSTPSEKGPLPGAEGPDRRAPFPPTPPGTERPGGEQVGTPD